MVDIHHVGTCAAPVSVAFAYIDDFRHATSWMFGLHALDPVDGKEQGLGATFDATFQVKPVSLHSTIQVTHWEQDSLIAFRSIKGFKNESSWRFIAEGEQQCRIEVVFSYDLPGGIAGKLTGKALEPIVALSVRHSDQALRTHIEAAYAAQS